MPRTVESPLDSAKIHPFLGIRVVKEGLCIFPPSLFLTDTREKLQWHENLQSGLGAENLLVAKRHGSSESRWGIKSSS